ncbi:MAG: RNA-binding S4 domain-containing protein [Clostridia bacterium]|nr:RNA-binding S4 domain-containing protein [Clostridia bacterium]
MKLKIKTRTVSIRTEYITLDSFLKFTGSVMSGGEAKTVILQGDVIVNNEVCTMRGKKLRNGDTVKYNGRVFEVLYEGSIS